MKKTLICTALLAAACLPAHAEGWTGSAELGFSNTTGNTKDRTLNTRLDMDHARGQWRHNIFGDIYHATSENVRTAERFALGYKPSHFLNDRDYIFGTARYDSDKFADIDTRWSQVVGLGRQLINSEQTYLEIEAGVGARQSKYIVNPDKLKRDEALLYTGARFNHRLSQNARILQNVRLEHGSANTYVESITGLQLKVTDAVSAKLTHTVRYNNKITGVQGKKTDQITGVNLVYSF
jgi:putative salt-induced outer membrane protein